MQDFHYSFVSSSIPPPLSSASFYPPHASSQHFRPHHFDKLPLWPSILSSCLAAPHSAFFSRYTHAACLLLKCPNHLTIIFVLIIDFLPILYNPITACSFVVPFLLSFQLPLVMLAASPASLVSHAKISSIGRGILTCSPLKLYMLASSRCVPLLAPYYFSLRPVKESHT